MTHASLYFSHRLLKLIILKYFHVVHFLLLNTMCVRVCVCIVGVRASMRTFVNRINQDVLIH